MSKKADIRARLERMEEGLGISHDVTLSDEDRLIQVVDRQYQVLGQIFRVLGLQVGGNASNFYISSSESLETPHHGTFD